MATAVFIFRTVLMTSLTLFVVAGLFELGVIGNIRILGGVIGNDRILGLDSYWVMMWSGAIAVLTAPIMVTYLYPLNDDAGASDDEEAES